MGIYIKGMEMPTQCLNCPLWKFIHVKGSWKDYCGASNFLIKDPYGKPDDCPLIEVPPHGDLIDLDEIDYPFGIGEDDGLFLGILDNMPIIIPADKDGE